MAQKGRDAMNRKTHKIKKIKINRASLEQALKEYDIGLMSTQNHWHLRADATGQCYVSEDTSYCISVAEFDGCEGAVQTIKHQSGYGDFDTANFATPEEAADYSAGEGIYAEQADQIIADLRQIYDDVVVEEGR